MSDDTEALITGKGVPDGLAFDGRRAALGPRDHMMGGGWWWLWGTLMMIMVLAAIALVVLLIVRSVQAGGGGARSARDILNDRYARGEIDTDEYEERISKLRCPSVCPSRRAHEVEPAQPVRPEQRTDQHKWRWADWPVRARPHS